MRYPIEFYRNLKLNQEVFYIKQYGVCQSKIISILITDELLSEGKIKSTPKIKLECWDDLTEYDYICLSADDLKKELFAFQTEKTG